MSNPWEEINLSDYEAHMSQESVFQLQALNEAMRSQLNTYPAESVMILGITAGNGLEYVNKEKIKKIYGVDINQNYLDECRKRFPELKDIMETLCVDLLDSRSELPQADLLIADLLVEYIGYDCFINTIRKVNPKYVSCVIQKNTSEEFVSDSPYIHVFDRLDEVHSQMEDYALNKAMESIGYKKIFRNEKPLPNGKKLIRIDFTK